MLNCAEAPALTRVARSAAASRVSAAGSATGLSQVIVKAPAAARIENKPKPKSIPFPSLICPRCDRRFASGSGPRDFSRQSEVYRKRVAGKASRKKFLCLSAKCGNRAPSIENRANILGCLAIPRYPARFGYRAGPSIIGSKRKMDGLKPVQHLPQVSRSAIDRSHRVMTVHDTEFARGPWHQLRKPCCARAADRHWVKPRLRPDQRSQQEADSDAQRQRPPARKGSRGTIHRSEPALASVTTQPVAGQLVERSARAQSWAWHVGRERTHLPRPAPTMRLSLQGRR